MTDWFERNQQYPIDDSILCYANGIIFIASVITVKGEKLYYSDNWGHVEFQNEPEWTHWMPLPKPPKTMV